MEYVDGGLYLSNDVCNDTMFVAGIVGGIGTAILKMSWVAMKPIIAEAICSIIMALSIPAIGSIIGMAVGVALAVTIAAYGISFFHAVYTAQQKGTGVDISFRWFRFRETYR